jgi:hypothetical protein
MSYWDGKRPPKENFATKDDIKKLEKDIAKLGKREGEPSTAGAAGKLVKGMAKGFGDVAKSLATPSTGRRMRIAQMVDGKNNPLRRTKVENPIAGRGAGIKRRRISNAPLD